MIVVLMLIGCRGENDSDVMEMEILIENAFEVARVQSINMALALKDEPELLPKTLTWARGQRWGLYGFTNSINYKLIRSIVFSE